MGEVEMAVLYPTLENIKRLKQEPTTGEWFLLNYLIENLSDEIEIYFQAFLNGDRPDIILMQKGVGVTVIEVKDWNLSSYTIDENNHWSLRSDGTKIKSPFQQVYYYKDQLFNVHVEGLLEKKLGNKQFYGRIKPLVYFYGSTKKDLDKLSYTAKNIIKDEEEHCHKKFRSHIISEDKYKACLDFFKNKRKKIDRDFNYVSIANDSLAKLSMPSQEFSELFTDEIYKEFHRILQPTHHTIEEGKDIFYTKKQNRLIVSTPLSTMKIKGVAGSGKTTILAKRAVNAHKRHGDTILILTYNLTLTKYIHDKISDVRENFDWKYFYIDNYHSFLKTAVKNTQKQNFEISDYENINIFSSFENEIQKYKTILIDEIQDYKPEWIKIIRKFFLEEDGEIVLFGDEKQNIYDRKLDEDTKIKVPNGFGRWKSLKTYIRFQGDGGRILNLTKKFQQAFFKGKYEIDENENLPTQSFLNLGLFNVKSYSMSNGNLYYDIVKDIHEKMKEFDIHPDDTVILSSRILVVRNIEYHLRHDFNQVNKTTFETLEMHNKYGKNPQLDDPCIPIKETNEINEIRRNKKRHFYFHNGDMKLSTIHSFKGGESQTIFLIINGCPHEESEHIYTAITRSKFNLQIYLINDSKFNNFFLNELNNENVEMSENILEKLKVAVSGKKTIDFDYETNNHISQHIDVKPYKILFMNDNYYLACEVNNQYKFSMYRINKISNLKISDKEFYYNMDIQNFVSDIQTPFSRYTDDYKEHMIKVLVELDETKASFFESKKFLPSQNIEEKLPNGNLLISYIVTQELEVEELIKKWLPYLKVIEPISLDEKIKLDIKKYLYI